MPEPKTVETSQRNNVSDGKASVPHVINGVKLIGEVLVPGASELIEGRMAKGVAALSAGLGLPVLSALVLGPVAALLVGGGSSIAVRASFIQRLPYSRGRREPNG